MFLHSGPRELYEEHRPVLAALGGTHTHLGEDAGRAAAYDIALLDIFWTAMAGYTHALALARAVRRNLEELGYSEASCFARTWRRLTGESPARYRARVLRAAEMQPA